MKPVELPDGTGWFLTATSPSEVPTTCDGCKRLRDAIRRHREEFVIDEALPADRELWKAAGIERGDD